MWPPPSIDLFDGPPVRCSRTHSLTTDDLQSVETRWKWSSWWRWEKNYMWLLREKPAKRGTKSGPKIHSFDLYIAHFPLCTECSRVRATRWRNIELYSREIGSRNVRLPRSKCRKDEVAVYPLFRSYTVTMNSTSLHLAIIHRAVSGSNLITCYPFCSSKSKVRRTTYRMYSNYRMHLIDMLYYLLICFIAILYVRLDFWLHGQVNFSCRSGSITYHAYVV